MVVINIRENPGYKEKAISYFQSKWASEESKMVYEDCISRSIVTASPLPNWYLLLDNDKIIGCAGLIANDFISWEDAWPWLCALHIEEEYRGNSLGEVLIEYIKKDTAKLGFDKLYLCTDHIDYYEKYGFSYAGTGYHPWGESSRVYECSVRSKAINEILLYEELSMNAHPAIRTQMYDGWVLRFANGYTNRANSINPLYLSTIPLEEKVVFCEELYTAQGLPTVYKLTLDSPQSLDKILGEKNYKKVTPTNIMTKPLAAIDGFTSKTTICQGITKTWQDNYFRLNGIVDSQKMKTAAIIQSNIQNKVLCGMIEENGKIVACGLCVIERGYAGLYDIVVDSSYRGNGYGFDVCSSLLNTAVDLGAKTAYLQVIAENVPAIALYQKLGFEDKYQYWYRVNS